GGGPGRRPRERGGEGGRARRGGAEGAGRRGGGGATAGRPGHAEPLEKPSSPRRESGGAREAVSPATPRSRPKARGWRRGPQERRGGGTPAGRRGPAGRGSFTGTGGRGGVRKAPLGPPGPA